MFGVDPCKEDEILEISQNAKRNQCLKKLTYIAERPNILKENLDMTVY